jgi:O-methyltransferase involved in polyketide biosynthesis
MLMTLYAHAQESQRSDAIIHGPRAEELVAGIDHDFSQSQLDATNQAAACVRLRQFDRFAQAFLDVHPDSIVVHIGCGLDTRFDRVDNGRVTWYDLDLPPVIALRRELLEETSRYKMLATDALDLAWLDVIGEQADKPLLVIAEGVFMYFTDAEMQRLVLTIHKRFPNAELVFDVASPLIIKLQNFKLARLKSDVRMHWALKDYNTLERWASGIRLLETWHYTSLNESIPRLRKLQMLFRLFPPLGKGMVILHYTLNQSDTEEAIPMKHQSVKIWGYLIAAVLGAVVGAVGMALVAQLIPKMMSQMMKEMPNMMRACMEQEGIDMPEMCQRMMAECSDQHKKNVEFKKD